MMDLPTDGKPLKSHLRRISVLVLLLLLTHHCRGQSQLIGSPQPIVTNLGDDIILPCYLEPAVNVAGLTLEWTRPDMDPRFVHVMRLGNELVEMKHQLFKGRTSMFTDELKNGNISLKLSNVQLSDLGKYRCFIPKLDRQAFVQLVFASGPSSPPVISLSGVDGQSGGVVLQCESAGWYPEPEVLWLDAEGKLLSAGPPETVRGPDDLYTVSSRVTVEKRPSNSFTCRVQHHNTTRTTQTHFHVPDDFFIVPSSCSASVAVSGLFGLMLVIAAVLFVWKWRQTKTGEKKNRSETEEGGQLMEETCNKKLLEEKNRGEKELNDLKREMESKFEKKLQEEKTGREEAEKELKEEVERLHTDLQRLTEEKRRREEEMETKMKERQKETQRKLADLWLIEEELKETQSLLEIQRAENSREKTEYNEQLRGMMTSKEVKDLQREMESKCNKKLLEEKNRGEEAEKEVKELNEEPQAGDFGGSDNSRSVEPPRTPPSTQTSDPGFNIEIDQQRKYIRLRNTSTEDKQMGQWELHLQVNNNKPFTYRFDRSFYLRAEGFVTMWAAGYGSSDSNTDLEWNDLKSLCSGDKLKFTLYNDTGNNMNTVWHNPK